MKLFILLMCISLCFSCGKRKKTPPQPANITDLQVMYLEKLNQAADLRDENGWLGRDCDEMIWTGKYGASLLVEDVNIEAAEYVHSGRFSRRPPPYCWTEEGGDAGSKTTWSRDMFTAGLLPYAWHSGKRDILERHASYGVQMNWVMGQPLADGRVLYTPQVIGLLYKAIHAMGGEYNVLSETPSLWPTGLDDYEAHLQVMQIYLKGEFAHQLGADAEADYSKLQLSISDAMYRRLEEHTLREPMCALYHAVRGLYNGYMQQALDILVEDKNDCEYLRCEHGACEIADWMFSASIVLREYGLGN